MAADSEILIERFSFNRHTDSSLAEVFPGDGEWMFEARMAECLSKLFEDKKFVLIINPFNKRRFQSYVRGNSFSRRLLTNEGFVLPSEDGNGKEFDIVSFGSNLVYKFDTGVYYVDLNCGTFSRAHREYLTFVEEDGCKWDDRSIRLFLTRLSCKIAESHEKDRKRNPRAFDGVFLKGDLLKDIRLDIENFLKSRRLYEEELKLPWRRGYLFWGSAGNGKTLTIRKLCEAYGLTHYDIGSFIGKNDGNIHMPDLFEYGLDYRLAPDSQEVIVVTVEDIDKFVAFQSGTGAHQDVPRVALHAILNALDGINQRGGLLVIGTTNYPEQLAEALGNRPGRFDKIFTFEKPSKTEILALLRYHKMEISDGPIEAVAAELEGYSMAFTSEFIKASKMSYCRNAIIRKEADIILRGIHRHNELFEKHFKTNGKSIGFLKHVQEA